MPLTLSSFFRLKRKTRSLVKTSVSVCVAFELLLIQLAIANPALHEWMHGKNQCASESASTSDCSDSTESEDGLGHVCAVTILADGLTSTTSLSVGATVEVIDSIEHKQVQSMPRILFRSNPARGPPIQA